KADEKKPPDKKPDDAAKKPEAKADDEKKAEEEPKEDPDADVPDAAIAERHRIWAEKLSGAKTLNAAGVQIAFTARDFKDLKDFWSAVRKIVKDGLPREAALRALTVNPATMLGLERQLGTIQAGKIANL